MQLRSFARLVGLVSCFCGSIQADPEPPHESNGQVQLEPSEGDLVASPFNGAELLDEPPPGIVAIRYSRDGTDQIRIALECRHPDPIDSGRSLVLLPWKEDEAPDEVLTWRGASWQPLKSLQVREGLLFGRGRKNSSRLPGLREWFNEVFSVSTVAIRKAIPVRDEEQEQLARRDRELEIEIASVIEKSRKLEQERRQILKSTESDQDKRVRGLKRRREIRRELPKLKAELNKLVSKIKEVGWPKPIPEFMVEYFALAAVPTPGLLPEGGVALLGETLITEEGRSPDLEAILRLLEPSLKDTWAWFQWDGADGLGLHIEGLLYGSFPGRKVEVRPFGDMAGLLTEEPDPARIMGEGGFRIRLHLQRPRSTQNLRIEFELVLSGPNDEEHPLGRWAADLLNSRAILPVQPLTGESLLPWRPIPDSRKPKEEQIKVVSTTDHPLGGILIDLAEADCGRLPVMLIENQSCVRSFDRWSNVWADLPEIEIQGEAMRIAGDAERIFVLDRGGERLRAISISNGEVLAEVSPDASILDMAAGHSSVSGPLMLVTPTHVESRSPVTLEPVRRMVEPPIQMMSRKPPATPDVASRVDLRSPRFKQPVTTATVLAAPDASGFYFNGREATPAKGWFFMTTMRFDGLNWQVGNASGFPGWQGRDTPSASTSTNPDLIENFRNVPGHTLLPTLGSGFLSVGTSRKSTIPALPVTMAYDTGGGQAVRFLSHCLAQYRSGLIGDRILFDPIRARLVTVADSALRVEQLDAGAFAERIPPAFRVAVPPPAIPGEKWIYAPGGKQSRIELGARSAELEVNIQGGNLEWDMPEDLYSSFLEIPLILNGEPFDLKIPVGSQNSPHR